jgi:hypothetical protein
MSQQRPKKTKTMVMVEKSSTPNSPVCRSTPSINGTIKQQVETSEMSLVALNFFESVFAISVLCIWNTSLGLGSNKAFDVYMIVRLK